MQRLQLAAIIHSMLPQIGLMKLGIGLGQGLATAPVRVRVIHVSGPGQVSGSSIKRSEGPSRALITLSAEPHRELGCSDNRQQSAVRRQALLHVTI